MPWGGRLDTCPPPATHLCSLDVPPAPSYAPPVPPQQAKPGESLRQGLQPGSISTGCSGRELGPHGM